MLAFIVIITNNTNFGLLTEYFTRCYSKVLINQLTAMSNHANQGSASTRQDVLFSVHPGFLEQTSRLQSLRHDHDLI